MRYVAIDNAPNPAKKSSAPRSVVALSGAVMPVSRERSASWDLALTPKSIRSALALSARSAKSEMAEDVDVVVVDDILLFKKPFPSVSSLDRLSLRQCQ